MYNAHSYLRTDKIQTYNINKRHYYVNRDDLGSRSLFYGSKYESLTLKNPIPIQKRSFRRQCWFKNLI